MYNDTKSILSISKDDSSTYLFKKLMNLCFKFIENP
jgi:hypothetical protein